MTLQRQGVGAQQGRVREAGEECDIRQLLLLPVRVWFDKQNRKSLYRPVNRKRFGSK